MNDGGCHYNLSAVRDDLHAKLLRWPGLGTVRDLLWHVRRRRLGLHHGHQERLCVLRRLATANANSSNNTGHITFTNNWVEQRSPVPASADPGNTGLGQHQHQRMNTGFPADAQTVVNAAGLESAYADLKTTP